MAAVSERLIRRVRRDFAPDEAEQVLALLATVPESLPGGARQDPERVQAALVLPARGDQRLFADLVVLGRTDWRDLLVSADLAHEGWPQRLASALAD